MSFGDFYTKICEQLKKGYGWNGPVAYLAANPELLNILYEEYSKHIKHDECNSALIESTCLRIDQFPSTSM